MKTKSRSNPRTAVKSSDRARPPRRQSGLEALRTVQFVKRNGKKYAVLDSRTWMQLVNWLEGLEDAQIVRDALAELKATHGDRRRAGWRLWTDVEGETA